MSTGVDEIAGRCITASMSKADQTRDKLLQAARAAFWARGYSNVSLRDIARAAGVDVALVSRYFGGKQGLFEAALEGAFDWPDLFDGTADPVGTIVAKFSDPAKEDFERQVVRMILMNATEPDVGPLVRAEMERKLLAPLRTRMGGEGAAANVALFVAVLLGASLARQGLQLHGLADQPAETYAAELRHLVDAALSFKAPPEGQTG